ncbi:MAG: SIMPL domain-containing protein [Dehalococcoidia bacterium]
MKKKLLLTVCMLAVVALAVTGCTTRGATGPSPIVGDMTAQPGVIFSQQQVGIWVNGEGKATAVPDIAMLSVGVEAQEPTVDAARQKAATAMDNIMKVLNDKGVDKKDIQTQQFSVYPVWQWNREKEKQELVGYQVTNMVSVKIRKIDTTGDVVDAVAVAGGDLVRINNISFTVDDQEPYLKEARDKAVKNAADKAEQLAGAAGVKLGNLIYMSESTGSMPVIRDTYLKAEAAGAPPVQTPVSPGELEYSINVQMVYGMQ